MKRERTSVLRAPACIGLVFSATLHSEKSESVHFIARVKEVIRRKGVNSSVVLDLFNPISKEVIQRAWHHDSKTRLEVEQVGAFPQQEEWEEFIEAASRGQSFAACCSEFGLKIVAWVAYMRP